MQNRNKLQEAIKLLENVNCKLQDKDIKYILSLLHEIRQANQAALESFSKLGKLDKWKMK